MKQRFPALLLLLVGAVLTAIGLRSGQNMAVLQKAARICLECVGIG